MEQKMDSKVARVIASHSLEFDKLSKESDLAIDTFNQTVVRLQEINNNIDNSVDLMDKQIEEIAKIKSGMLERKIQNDKVKTKIQEFLS